MARSFCHLPTIIFPPPDIDGNPYNPFIKDSIEARAICGQITAYVTTHMSVQFQTHVFSILICNDYAQLIRWDRSGAVVTEQIFYNTQPDLIDFFVHFDHSPPIVQGKDGVRDASPKETEDVVQVVKELKGLVGSKLKLLVVSFPNPAAGGSLEYVIEPPRASPWVPVGRWT